MTDTITKYFPELSSCQKDQFAALQEVFSNWNAKINVISRKDMDNFYIHHVLHSISIAKIISFNDHTKILDVGTGGGFPGIPLAILFPKTEFFLLDSIGKKIKVVESVASALGLENVTPIRKRAEEEKGKYDFVVCRAVAKFHELINLTAKNIGNIDRNSLKNGLICLKGGDVAKELDNYADRAMIWRISDFFNEPYFESKKIIYLNLWFFLKTK